MPRRTHGLSKSRIYSIWTDMKKRCDNKKHISYPYYGGRGISYDESWNDFNNFYSDMYVTYSDELSLDRINPSKNYSKDNCRWVDYDVQSKNKLIYSSNTLQISNIFHIINKGVPSLASKITRNGKSYKKSISLRKYSFEEAVEILTEWRNGKREELNFSEFHGGLIEI